MGSSPKSAKAPYAGQTYTFCHAELGYLTGRLVASRHFPDSAVVQFRSIPYATVPKRFAPSVPLGCIPPDFDSRPHRDFTNYGAACPQLGGQSPAWSTPWAGPLPDDEKLEFDEFRCLSVSVSVPESHLASTMSSRLPVMIYIHGGGASEGTGHVDGLHSNAPLTSYAASIGQPVITVNVGYRLGWLAGFTSQDVLDDFASAPNSPHGPFNLAIQDQRHAFAWVNKFIGGFGGNALNMTSFGESAGSVFLVYHICGSLTRLFDRAILQSGLFFGHMSFEVKEEEYQATLKHFKIEGATSRERLNALREVDVQELIQLPGSHMTPYVDDIPGISQENSLFARGRMAVATQANLIATCEWLGDLVIGDVFWEGHLFHPMLLNCPQSRLIQAVREMLPISEAETLLEAYDLPSTETSPAAMQMSLLVGDAMFSWPCHELVNVLGSQVSGKKRNVYRYSFCLSNPFPGTPFNFVTGHHFVEILFLFLTLLDRYSSRRNGWLARQAKDTARRWITFANGHAPWEPYIVSSNGSSDDSKIATCDDLVGWSIRTLKEDEEVSKNDPWGERRYAGWRAFSAAFDAMKRLDENAATFNHHITMARLKLMQLVYGDNIYIKLSDSVLTI